MKKMTICALLLLVGVVPQTEAMMLKFKTMFGTVKNKLGTLFGSCPEYRQSQPLETGDIADEQNLRNWTNHLNAQLADYYKKYSTNKNTEQRIIVPEASVLRERLEKIGGLKHFVEKTKIDKKLAGRKLAPEGINVAIEEALYEYAQDHDNPTMNIIMQQRKPRLIKIFIDREWEKNVVKDKLSEYLNYIVAKNPELMIKHKQKIHSAEDVIAPEDRPFMLKRALEKCVQNNDEKDCEEAFSYVASNLFKDKDGYF